MTIRIAVWLCVLLGVSGCGASLAEPSDVASDDLGLQNGEDAKNGTNAAKDELDPKKSSEPDKGEPGVKDSAKDAVEPKKGVDPANSEGVATRCESSSKPADSDVEGCYVKAKRCYIDSEDAAQCDELLEHCSTLADEPPKPTRDDCAVQIEGCQKSAKGAEDCSAIKAACVTPPPPAKPVETTSEFEACWRKYKDCYAEGNDPALCESVGESCKKLERTDLQ